MIGERIDIPFFGDAVDIFEAVAPLGGAILVENSVADAADAESLIVCDPWCLVEFGPRGGFLRRRDGEALLAVDLFSTLRNALSERFGDGAPGGGTSAAGFDRFDGGLVGFCGYDARIDVAAVPDRNPPDTSLPRAAFGVYDLWLRHCPRNRTVSLWTRRGTDTATMEVRRRAVMDAIAGFRGSRIPVSPPPKERSVAASNFSFDEYVDRVNRTKERIRAGDVYQLNLTHRFRVPCDERPIDVYRRLRARHGSRYSAFFSWNGAAVLSASPECFFDVRGRDVETRPIKGTIARRTDPADDLLQRDRLSKSKKDVAELTMIVDLLRNDIHRVALPGSVRVVDHAHIESFPTVHHLVTGVTGRLEKGRDVFDLLRAAFPGGSISGCPKLRAMEIIDELETIRRGVYTGSIGWIAAGGDAVLNIAIRTMVIEDGAARVYSGGGITIDSDPVAEYRETIDKVRGLLAVLGAEPPAPPESFAIPVSSEELP